MSAAVLTGQDERACGNTAGDVRLAVADGLTAHEFDVLDPAGEGSQYLKVTNARNALCEIMISEHGSVSWEYRPFSGGPSSAQITGMVLDLLGAEDREDWDASLSRGPGLTLTGIVGRALRERGMRVWPAEADRDDRIGELCAEIVVINPARPDRGNARVGDDGMIRWECHLNGPAAAASAQGIEPSEIAGTIARALNRPRAVSSGLMPPTATRADAPSIAPARCGIHATAAP